MGIIDKQKFTVISWVQSTFLGWILGFILTSVLAGGFDLIGIENVQFVLGVGMGAGVGFMQWLMFRRVFLIHKKWIWFSTLGLTIPFLFFDLLNFLSDFTLGVYFLPLSTGLGGIIIGLLQFRIIDAISRKGKLWIVASTLGWFSAALTASSIDYINWAGANMIIILCGGVVLGIITGMFLRKILELK